MSLKRHTFYNLVGSLAPIVVGLVTVPLYLEKIGAARFGILGILWLLVGYFTLFNLGLPRATSNLVAQLRDAPYDERARLFGTALLLNAVLGCLGGLFLYALGLPFLAHWMSMPPTVRREALEALPWLAAGLPVVLVNGVFGGVLQGCRWFGALNLTQAIGSTLTATVPLIVAYTVSPSLAVLIPVVIGIRILMTVPMALLAAHSLPLKGPPRFARDFVGRLLGYGLWITVSDIVSPILTSLDQFLIGTISGATALAYYLVPSRIISRVPLLPAALSSALFPELSATDRQTAFHLTREAVRTLNALMVPLIVFGLLAIHPFLVLWVGARIARPSTPVGEILLVGIWINSLAYLPYALLQAQGRPDLTARFHLLETLPFLVVLWFGLQLWGIAGAAMAWTLRVSADAFLLFWAARDRQAYRDILWPGGVMVITTFLAVYFLPPAGEIVGLAWALLAFGLSSVWALSTTPRLRRELMTLVTRMGLAER